MTDSLKTTTRPWPEQALLWAAAYRASAKTAREGGSYWQAEDWDRHAEELEAQANAST